MDEIRLPTLEVHESSLTSSPLERLMPAQFAESLATLTTGYTPDPGQEQKEPTYYDYPVLKPPIWRWEIVWYFFFGGLAAGCYVIASLAALFGSREDRATARTGYYLSLLALLPCPILLIKDLGRPERSGCAAGSRRRSTGTRTRSCWAAPERVRGSTRGPRASDPRLRPFRSRVGYRR